ncbi:MAG: two-component sensor histidine kinase [Acidimicrobiales bacterium]|nr:two-component sensor histidine kinase [Acidimicrobiales bacterium]
MTRRVLVAILLVAALAVTGFGVPLGAVINRLYERDAILRLEREATAATIEVPASSLGAGGDLPELPKERNGTRFSLYLPTGQRLAGLGPIQSAGVAKAGLSGVVVDGRNGSRMFVAVPVTSREKVIAVVWADRSMAPVRSRTREAWAAMVGLAFVVLLLSTLFAFALVRRLVRPVRELGVAAARLGDGDFATRAGRSGIGEVDRVAEALDSTAERLGAVLERERAFSADASHQLRTPLTALRVHLAAASETADEETNASIDLALEDVGRLGQTVDDMLRLARDAVVVGDLDLRAVLSDLERAWHGRLAAAGRALVISAPLVPPALRASKAALGQVLDVLLSNAEIHGRDTVTVTVREIAAGVAIEVSDEGPGITGDAEAIFTRRGADASGYGIGLALARSLTEAEGGRLLLRTDAPTTTFAILFPISDP